MPSFIHSVATYRLLSLLAVVVPYASYGLSCYCLRTRWFPEGWLQYSRIRAVCWPRVGQAGCRVRAGLGQAGCRVRAGLGQAGCRVRAGLGQGLGCGRGMVVVGGGCVTCRPRRATCGPALCEHSALEADTCPPLDECGFYGPRWGVGVGAAGACYVRGRAGACYVRGRAGACYVRGGAGACYVRGRAGACYVRSRAGACYVSMLREG